MKKILTIGNSFSINALRFLRDMDRSVNGPGIYTGSVNLDYTSLEKHWNLYEQARQIPDVKPYTLKINNIPARPADLTDALRWENWDFIVLQQTSNGSCIKESFEPWLGNLIGVIREFSPESQILLHQTWAYRIDAPQLEEWGIDQEEMFEKVRDNYEFYSKKYGTGILPSGAAIQNARKLLGYREDRSFNYDNPVYPDLPEQGNSLIKGYVWRTGNTSSGKAFLDRDVIHCNALGSYLLATLWSEMITGTSPKDSDFCPPGVTRVQTELMKEAAALTVKEYGGPLSGPDVIA